MKGRFMKRISEGILPWSCFQLGLFRSGAATSTSTAEPNITLTKVPDPPEMPSLRLCLAIQDCSGIVIHRGPHRWKLGNFEAEYTCCTYPTNLCWRHLPVFARNADSGSERLRRWTGSTYGTRQPDSPSRVRVIAPTGQNLSGKVTDRTLRQPGTTQQHPRYRQTWTRSL